MAMAAMRLRGKPDPTNRPRVGRVMSIVSLTIATPEHKDRDIPNRMMPVEMTRESRTQG